VQRNRVRRLLRESYRQRNSALRLLCARHHIALRCVFLLNAQAIGRSLSYAEVDEAMHSILTGLEEKLQAS
jgi:RNase P protein component